MIERLLEFSVRKRGLVILLTLVFVVVGLIAGARVPIDAVPDVTNVQVQVITAAPAFGPTDVEAYVTAPIERTMAGLPNVSEIRSISRPGISVVTIAFEDGVPLQEARYLVDQRLSDAKQEIPADVGNPQLGPMSSGLGEVVHFEVKGSNHSLMELRTTLDWIIAPRLKLVSGVTEVNTFGGEAKTLEISLDPKRLREAKVGVSDVLSAVRNNHLAVGGAYLIDDRETVSVRADARVQSLEEIGLISIERRGDRTPLLIRDVADVRYAPRVRYGAVTRDGRGEAVVGVVMMVVGANSAEVVKNIKDALDDLGNRSQMASPLIRTTSEVFL